MKSSKLFILIAFAALLGLAGFSVAAAPHDCPAHCAKHTDDGAKMCMDHCSTGGAPGHDCAVHCKSLPGEDADQACAVHCSNAKE